ncbi:MAG: tetratricopeptide repeat protein [Phycisphaerales bacterium]
MVRRTRVVAASLMLGAAAVALGCASSARPRDPAMISPERRHSEAVKAAGEAEKLANSGRIDEAIAKYQEALAMAGDLQGAWNNLGELYMRRGDYADAVSAFGVAADLVPTDPRPLYNSGLVYQKVGWAKDAMEQYARALERDPSMQDALRGHTVAADMLAYADQKTLDYIRRGLLREKDPTWRAFFERQRFRVEAQMRSEAERN